jgi:hypothetical protein
VGIKVPVLDPSPIVIQTPFRPSDALELQMKRSSSSRSSIIKGSLQPDKGPDWIPTICLHDKSVGTISVMTARTPRPHLNIRTAPTIADTGPRIN